MPFNVSRTQTQTGKEVLKFPVGDHAVKSVVLDATMFAVDTTDGARYQVPAGTILKLSTTNPARMVEYNGTGTIKGILKSPIDMLSRATNSNEPAAMWWFGCVFATTAIVGFTNYASALVADLASCRFE
jgi:urease beta subunit